MSDSRHSEAEIAQAAQEILLLIRLPSANLRVAERLLDRLPGVRSQKAWCLVLRGLASSLGRVGLGNLKAGCVWDLVRFSFLQTTVVNKSQAGVCTPCIIMPPGEHLNYTKPRCPPD